MPAPSFLIKNGGTDFMNRQKSIFDILSVVERETSLSTASTHSPTEIDDSLSRSKKRKRTKRFLGKESIFKAPMDRPPRFKRPQHIHAPGKRWIKYSLADVSDYDLSNEANTAAALSFLKTLKDRKTEEKDEKVDVNQKHLFKSIVNNVENENEPGMSKAVFKSSKLIMPEYVVGQSKTVKKRIQRVMPATSNNKEVYLDHIHEQEDNVDDE